MEYCYYPVRESELKAVVIRAKSGQVTQIGGAKVTPVLMNTLFSNFGHYRSRWAEGVLHGDHEP